MSDEEYPDDILDSFMYYLTDKLVENDSFEEVQKALDDDNVVIIHTDSELEDHDGEQLINLKEDTNIESTIVYNVSELKSTIDSLLNTNKKILFLLDLKARSEENGINTDDILTPIGIEDY